MTRTRTKVLFVDHAPIYGGAEIMVVRLASALRNERITPVVAVGDCRQMVDALRERGVEYRVLELRPLNRRRLASALSLWQGAFCLWRLACAERADVIHTNTLRSHILGAMAAPLARRPLVWTLHDFTFPRLLFRCLSPFASRIICVSHTVMEYYAPYCISRNKLHVIYNGVEAGRASVEDRQAIRARLGIGSGSKIVLLPGRLVGGKGHDTFLNAAATVTPLDSSAVFVIAGGSARPSGAGDQLVQMSATHSGGPEYERELHGLVERLGLVGSVIFAGHVLDMDALYAAATVVVHAGTMQEGLGAVPLEAMAAARPVVATDLPAIRETVEDGVTGILVPAGDADCLGEKIGLLLADSDLAYRMGQAGHERARRLFDSERQAAEYVALYHSLLGR